MTDSFTLGSYRLIAELGHGGMADVYLAAVQGPVGSGFTKLAVVKRLRSHLAETPEFVAMLLDEARITARLAHPNVVQLFEVGEIDGQWVLAMEYLDGQPLHRIQRRVSSLGRSVPRELYYTVVSDILAGLHHAHELADYDGTPLGVVHRDVTPHNVFVTYDGVVKVVDFGIAKAAGRACETQCATIKGKVRYMSPEQAAGLPVDRRADIFAVGVILWNMATGSKLWGERSEVDIVLALTTNTYDPSPRAHSPHVPRAIDDICRKALAYRKEDRYASADEMRAEIEAYLGRTNRDLRKALAELMRELFKADRAKVRQVVEEASLMSVASVDAFTAGAGMRTLATPFDAPSVSPMSAPADDSLLRTLTRPAPATPTPTPPTRRRRRLLPFAVLAVAIVLLGAAGAKRLRTPGSLPSPRAAAAVARELTASSDEGSRVKDATMTEHPYAAATRSPKTASRNAAPPPPHTVAPSAITAPVTPDEAGKATTRPRALDASDPWVDGSTHAR